MFFMFIPRILVKGWGFLYVFHVYTTNSGERLVGFLYVFVGFTRWDHGKTITSTVRWKPFFSSEAAGSLYALALLDVTDETGWASPWAICGIWVDFRCQRFLHFSGVSMVQHGHGSIPINTIFRGMTIHLPAILMFTRGTRFWHTATWFNSSSSHFFDFLLVKYLTSARPLPDLLCPFNWNLMMCSCSLNWMRHGSATSLTILTWPPGGQHPEGKIWIPSQPIKSSNIFFFKVKRTITTGIKSRKTS